MNEHVKVRGVVPRIQYIADGVLATYEFPFAIFSESDIQVYLNDIQQAQNTYTVAGVRHSDGGSITFNTLPEQGEIITIIRNLSIERTTDFQEGGALRADTLNDELDYQIACQQQIADHLNRSMVLPPYAVGNDVNLTLPTPSAGKAIVWNAGGTNLENSEIEINRISQEMNAKVNEATAQAGISLTAAETATVQAQTATAQANIAISQAGLATQKAAEASAALSGKANVNLDNLSDYGKETIARFALPSNNYVDLESPVNGTATSYVAPANGYFVIHMSQAASGYLLIFANASAGGIGYSVPSAGGELYVTCPAKKNDGCWCYVNGTVDYCRFVYSEGEI